MTVDDVVWTPEDKAKLRDRGPTSSKWRATGSARRLLSEDCRSWRFGRVGRSDHHLVDIPNLFDEHGNVISASVIAYTREHPEAIPLIAEQHANGGRALESLTRFLESFLPRLDRSLRPQSLR